MPGSRPGNAKHGERVIGTSSDTEGYHWPKLEPKASAAARACAQEMRVDGLLRSAMSTTPATVRLSDPGTATTGAAAAVSATALRGGVQYSLGRGGAPGTPPIDGGLCTHAPRRPTATPAVQRSAARITGAPARQSLRSQSRRPPPAGDAGGAPDGCWGPRRAVRHGRPRSIPRGSGPT